MSDSNDKSEIYLPDNDGKTEIIMEDQIKQMMNAMESMQTRLVMTEAWLVMTEAALVEARVASTMTQKTTGMAPPVDTRSIGKAPSFSGEHKEWHDWSFHFTAYMGSANARAIDALKAAATSELAITSEDLHLMGDEYVEMSTQLYFGPAMLCKGAALTTVKNVTGNNGLDAWRALCALYDPGSRGRQRVRMQQLLQPKRPEQVAQTVEAVERWGYDIREYETKFNKQLDDDVKIGVILAMSPIAVQNHCHLNAPDLKTYGAVRLVVMEYCRAQVDIGIEMADPMDLSAMWKGKGKGDKGGKDDKGGKYGKGGKNGKDGKGKYPEGKGKSYAGKAKSEPFDGYCTYCKKHGHRMRDGWARAAETASGSTATVERAAETVLATAGSLLWADPEEGAGDRGAGWLLSIDRDIRTDRRTSSLTRALP